MASRKVSSQTSRIAGVADVIDEALDDEISPSGTLVRDIMRQLPRMPYKEARYLYWLYQSFQRERLAASNRIRVIRKDGGNPLMMEHFFHQYMELEKAMGKALAYWVKEERVYNEWLKNIRGIGPTLGAGLIAFVRPEYSRTAGSIWRYAGIDVGPMDELATTKYSRTFQKLCWLVGRSFIYSKPRTEDQYSFYYEMYLRRKKYEISRNERGELADQAAARLKAFNYGRTTVAFKEYSAGRLPKAHIHARAIRWTVKLFLSHLAHVTYELAYGEPPPAPYVIAIKGHKDFIGIPFFETKADYAIVGSDRNITTLPELDAADLIDDDEFDGDVFGENFHGESSI